MQHLVALCRGRYLRQGASLSPYRTPWRWLDSLCLEQNRVLDAPLKLLEQIRPHVAYHQREAPVDVPKLCGIKSGICFVAQLTIIAATMYPK